MWTYDSLQKELEDQKTQEEEMDLKCKNVRIVS